MCVCNFFYLLISHIVSCSYEMYAVKRKCKPKSNQTSAHALKSENELASISECGCHCKYENAQCTHHFFSRSVDELSVRTCMGALHIAQDLPSINDAKLCRKCIIYPYAIHTMHVFALVHVKACLCLSGRLQIKHTFEYRTQSFCLRL